MTRSLVGSPSSWCWQQFDAVVDRARLTLTPAMLSGFAGNSTFDNEPQVLVKAMRNIDMIVKFQNYIPTHTRIYFGLIRNARAWLEMSIAAVSSDLPSRKTALLQLTCTQPMMTDAELFVSKNFKM